MTLAQMVLTELIRCIYSRSHKHAC